MSENLPPSPDQRVFIGQITKVRGLRGDLKIFPTTWRPERFQELETIWCLLAGEETRLFTIKRVRLENNIVYVRFREAPTRELAEPLVGGELFIEEENRDSLPADTYFYDDLIGCKVNCKVHGDLGVIEEIISQSAQDIWQVKGQYGEVLIPSVRDIVQKVDIDSREIIVKLPEGLVEPTD